MHGLHTRDEKRELETPLRPKRANRTAVRIQESTAEQEGQPDTNQHASKMPVSCSARKENAQTVKESLFLRSDTQHPYAGSMKQEKYLEPLRSRGSKSGAGLLMFQGKN